MKLAYLFPICFILQGCFMYDNFKSGISCSFDSEKCVDIEAEDQKHIQEVQNKTIEAIKERCMKELKFKVGSMELMRCSEAYLTMFNYDTRVSDIDVAYANLTHTLYSQKQKCADYGITENSKNYQSCINELHVKYLNQRASIIEEQKRQQERLSNQIFQQSLQNNLINQMNKPRTCYTSYLGGTATQTCY